MNKKGSALILVIFVVVVLVTLSIAVISRTVSEHNISQKNFDSAIAFWSAEAGLNEALKELLGDYNQCGTNVFSATLSSVDASYSVDINCSGQNRNITSTGVVPATGVARMQRVIQATIKKEVPANFYDNAIYSAGDIDLNGNSYSVTGDVRYADDCDNPDNITGNVTEDPTISPLARLDYQQLLTISQSQGNVYDGSRLQDIKNGSDSFPPSFWYSPPTDPGDPTTGIPNVVYVTEDLQLNGNIGTIGGFFVVVGDVVTNPDDVQDATINGNGTIEGAIYTRGEFRINGGGGNLNINGGVWAGEEARLNGNAHVTYNYDYMKAIEALNIDTDAQITSWKEQGSSYELVP